MKVFSVLLLAVFLLSMLALPAAASTEATPPPMPTISLDSGSTAETQLPANLGSIIGLVLAALMVVAIVVILILKKKKKK